jgi:hypothetical protein
MKRLVILTGIIVYILFAISAFIAIASEETEDYTQLATATEAVTQYSSEDIFLVKNQEGKVVVLNNETKEIIEKTDTQVSLLPKTDQKKLEDGIVVQGKKELRKILEDLCS